MATPSISPSRVLVVDDEVLIRWSIQETLEARGCFVSVAATSKEALDLASGADPFDVILLDLRLPDSSDLRLLKELRTQLPAARIIMMTAYATPDLAEASMTLGAERCIGKPFLLDDLTALVTAA